MNVGIIKVVTVKIISIIMVKTMCYIKQIQRKSYTDKKCHSKL
jgi:hypothetical protein